MLELLNHKKKTNKIFYQNDSMNLLNQNEMNNHFKIFQDIGSKSKLTSLLENKKPSENYTMIDIADMICQSEFKNCEEQLARVTMEITKKIDKSKSPNDKMEEIKQQQSLLNHIKAISEERYLMKPKKLYVTKKGTNIIKKDENIEDDLDTSLHNLQFLAYKKNPCKILKAGNLNAELNKKKLKNSPNSPADSDNVNNVKHVETKKSMIIQPANTKSNSGYLSSTVNNQNEGQKVSNKSLLCETNNKDSDKRPGNEYPKLSRNIGNESPFNTLNSSTISLNCEVSDNPRPNQLLANPLLDNTTNHKPNRPTTSIPITTTTQSFNENPEQELRISDSPPGDFDSRRCLTSKQQQHQPHQLPPSHTYRTLHSNHIDLSIKKHMRSDSPSKSKILSLFEKVSVTQIIPEVEEDKENNDFYKTNETIQFQNLNMNMNKSYGDDISPERTIDNRAFKTAIETRSKEYLLGDNMYMMTKGSNTYGKTGEIYQKYGENMEGNMQILCKNEQVLKIDMLDRDRFSEFGSINDSPVLSSKNQSTLLLLSEDFEKNSCDQLIKSLKKINYARRKKQFRNKSFDRGNHTSQEIIDDNKLNSQSISLLHKLNNNESDIQLDPVDIGTRVIVGGRGGVEGSDIASALDDTVNIKDNIQLIQKSISRLALSTKEKIKRKNKRRMNTNTTSMANNNVANTANTTNTTNTTGVSIGASNRPKPFRNSITPTDLYRKRYSLIPSIFNQSFDHNSQERTSNNPNKHSHQSGLTNEVNESKQKPRRNTIFVKVIKAPPIELDELSQKNLEIEKLLKSVGLKEEESDTKIIPERGKSSHDLEDSMIESNKRSGSVVDNAYQNEKDALVKPQTANQTQEIGLNSSTCVGLQNQAGLPNLRRISTTDKKSRRLNDSARHNHRANTSFLSQLKSSKNMSKSMKNSLQFEISKSPLIMKIPSNLISIQFDDKFLDEKQKINDLVQACKDLNKELFENRANLEVEEYKYEFKRNIIKSVHQALGELRCEDPKMLKLNYLHRKEDLLYQIEDEEKALNEHLEKVYKLRQADRLLKKNLVNNTKGFRPALKMHTSNIREFREQYIPNHT